MKKFLVTSLVILGVSLLFQTSVSAEINGNLNDINQIQSLNLVEPYEIVENEESGVIAYIYPTPQITLFGAGEWDYMGSEYLGFNRKNIYGKEIKSGGGNFKVEIPPHSFHSGEKILGVTLYENDELGSSNKLSYLTYDSNDDIVKDGVTVFFGRIPTDGVNGKAELQVKYDPDYTTRRAFQVKYYD